MSSCIDIVGDRMDYKILINKDNRVTKNLLNMLSLVAVKNDLDEDILIEKKTYSKYKKLKEYLLDKGISISIRSAYQEGDTASDAHTGLVIDLVVDENLKEEIVEVLHHFGFIMRGSLKDRVKIRYVGYSTANIIYNEHLSLEEYHQRYNQHGILLVNKPSGMTSREVDNLISRKFDTKKVGHTGTLDPLASGVLIVLIGNATKIGSDIVSQDKSYIATVKMGLQTDTLDITGKILAEKKDYKIDDLELLLKSFEKTYMQEVPIYSAVKVNGKKLYEYARHGEEVDLPKKEVTIRKIELLNRSEDTFTFKCSVSKGTYIRSLIRDMGEYANCPFVMQDLIRIEEAGFVIDDCYTLEDIENNHFKVLPIDKVLSYPVIEISYDDLKKISNGCSIQNIYQIEDRVIFKYGGEVVAIYQNIGGQLKSYRQFVSG